MADKQQLGKEAEEQAADYLLQLGYCMVTRRFRVRGGEIDLICLDGDVLVFVEVKAKYAPGFVPEEAVGQSKVTRMERAANEYRKRMEETRPYRFDVIAIDRNGLRHHKHIFNS
jgi:putative endonuclease